MKLLTNCMLPLSLSGHGPGKKSLIAIKKTALFPVLLVLLCFTCAPFLSFGQLSGTYTIDPGSAASKTNYKNFRSAVADLDSGKRYDGGTANGKGVSGAVTFKIADGTYNEKHIVITTIAGSSAQNTVTFTSTSGDSSKVIIKDTVYNALEMNTTSYVTFSKLTLYGKYSFTTYNCHNITLQSCFLRNAYIYMQGDDPIGLGSNIVIRNNWLYNAGMTVASNYLTDTGLIIENNIIDGAYYGIDVRNELGSIIRGNKIGTRDTISAVGMRIQGGTVLEISHNIINTLYVGIDIEGGSTFTTKPLLIYNNAITTGYDGLYIDKGNNPVDIYFNSLLTKKSSVGVFALAVLTPRRTRIMNNNLVAYGGTAFKGYISNDSLTMDYNNLYAKDSIVEGFKNYANLADWVADAGQDAHSISIDPKYININDPRPHNAAFVAGTPIAGLNYDLDSVKRKTLPTIGAYEFRSSCLSGAYTINPSKAASLTNYKDFHSAIADLDSGKRYDGGPVNGSGICGPVVFKVADGTYKEHIFITKIAGSSALNTVTFTSQSGDSSKVIIQDSANSVFLLDSVSYVSVDKLSIKGQYTVLIKNCDHVNVQSCVLRNGLIYIYYEKTKGIASYNAIRGSRLLSSGILAYSSYLSDTGLIIENNIIDKAYIGIELHNEFGTIIRGNKIGTSDSVTSVGIYMHQGTLVEISHNIINTLSTGISIEGSSINIKQPLHIYENAITTGYTALYINGVNSPLDIYFNSLLVKKHATGVFALGLFDTYKARVIDNNLVAYGGAAFKAGLSYDSLTMDYNNLYGTDSIVEGVKNYKVLADWVHDAGQDAHSISIDPKYVSISDPRPHNVAFVAGIGIAGLNYDLDSVKRRSVPTIGAYEAAKFIDTFSTCKGSCLGLTSPLAGKKYRWSTGDTTKNITYCPTKDTLVKGMVWGSAGDSAGFSYFVKINTADCVWPGDANSNKKADIKDVLAIGIAYSDTGAKRPGATTNWTGQACDDWAASFKSGVNHKHADCNGDGIVDKYDLKPIVLNFGKTHTKAANAATGNATDPPLIISFTKDSVASGDTAIAIITLGSNTIKANDVYGLALSVNYGNLTPKMILPDFSTSWLGTINSDMVSLTVNDSVNKIMYIGLSRTDHKNVSGYGQIGVLSIMMPDNIAGKREVKELFKLEIADYKCINATEDNVPLNPSADSIMVYQYKDGINNQPQPEAILRIYPNPASTILHLSSAIGPVNGITITDVMGKAVYERSVNNQSETDVPVTGFSKGVYILTIKTAKGEYRARFIKN